MKTNKYLIITIVLLLTTINVLVAKDMPTPFGPPTPPADAPLQGMWALLIAGIYYGFRKLN